MLPTGFEQRMKALLQDEFDAYLASYDRPRNVGLRFNPLKADDLTQLPFGLEPIPWAAHGYYYNPETRPGLHPYHEAGVYYLQEPSAMAPVSLLDPQPGETVLDLCAAPGGKTTQIAAAMQGQGLLICNEIHPARAKILSRNIERMGVTNALVLNETPQKLAKHFHHCFDRILVDAPCSGEGMFRKEEAAVTDWSEDAVAHCAARQQEILAQVAGMLKPGGRLVYSTCTFAPAENEGTIGTFLQAHPEFRILELPNEYFSPGQPAWSDCAAADLEKTYRLWPHKLRGEGHYAAVLEYTGDEHDRPAPAATTKVPALWTEFAKENDLVIPAGNDILFGDTLCRIPVGMPALQGLKVLRAGLELGRLCKNRFEPAHALALALKNAARVCDLTPDSDLLRRYLQGETIPGEQKGWTLVRADCYSIGWAKGSGGILKNHFPKGLRWNSSMGRL